MTLDEGGERGEEEGRRMVLNNYAMLGWKAPVKASVSGVSLLSFSLFFAPLPSFPLKTPDTRANTGHQPAADHIS